MYLDKDGLIVQADGDGGDKLQREGFWYEGTNFCPREQIRGMAYYHAALAILSDQEGNLMRDQIKWTDPKDVSRDQLVSNIRAIGYRTYGSSLDIFYQAKLKRILTNVIKNFSRYPNGDLAFLIDYSRFARAFGTWWLYPLILLGDLQMLANTLIRLWAGRNPDDVGDDINHIGDLAQARLSLPSPISWLARKLYVWFRRPTRYWPIEHYFRAESGANTEFIDLWKPILEKF